MSLPASKQPGAERLPCSECGLPSAQIVNGSLLIESRHHGKVHRNVFSLEWLKRKIEEAEREKPEVAGAK